MYNYIEGTVVDIQTNMIVIACNGIGYEIYATRSCIQQCEINQSAKVYLYLAVKEDSMSLFGFVDLRERLMFGNLTNVNGVGNKTAISILSGISLQELAVSVASQNTSALHKIKGVGKKTAERILLELRDKVAKDDSIKVVVADACNDNARHAQEALLALGFRSTEVNDMMRGIELSNLSAEDIIGLALRRR